MLMQAIARTPSLARLQAAMHESLTKTPMDTSDPAGGGEASLSARMSLVDRKPA